MKITVRKYVLYLWTGYMWGRCFSSLYALIDNPEGWSLLLFYAFFSIFFTTMDIIEIKVIEKKWFDTEEARVCGAESEEK